jgi:hypothetical protein
MISNCQATYLKLELPHYCRPCVLIMCRFCCRWLHGKLHGRKFWGCIIFVGVYISYTHFNIGMCVCVLFCRSMDGILQINLTPSHLLTHTVSAWHPVNYIV